MACSSHSHGLTDTSQGIKDLLEDLNPQLQSTIDNEFEKVEAIAAPEPTRTSADVLTMAPSTSGKYGVASDALDDLFPRVEIDGLLKGSSILADAKSESWKTKKEALEALQAILDQGSNKRLKPNMGESWLSNNGWSDSPVRRGYRTSSQSTGDGYEQGRTKSCIGHCLSDCSWHGQAV